MVINPNREMGVDGCRRLQMYMGTKARGEERKGRLKRGERARSMREERKRSQK
jgi:hypothetical protein